MKIPSLNFNSLPTKISLCTLMSAAVLYAGREVFQIAYLQGQSIPLMVACTAVVLTIQSLSMNFLRQQSVSAPNSFNATKDIATFKGRVAMISAIWMPSGILTVVCGGNSISFFATIYVLKNLVASIYYLGTNNI